MRDVGLNFVAANFDKFVDKVGKAINVADALNKSLEQTENTTRSQRGISKLSRTLENFATRNKDRIEDLSDVLEVLPGNFGGLADGLRGATAALTNYRSVLAAVGPATIAVGAAITGLVGAIAGLAAAFAGFVSLGRRGAPIQGIALSFEALTGEAVLASETLDELRAAADGTISDVQLLTATNIALAGSTGDFRTEFQAALPTLVETARAAAQLRGVDPSQAFNDLVEGIKKAEPEIIDNLGITLRLEEAYNAYAAELGKSANQLTQVERSQAVLNATLDGAQGLIDSVGGTVVTNATKISQIQTLLANTLDRFAIAIQPAFGLVLDFILATINKFSELGNAIERSLGGLDELFLSIGTAISSFVLPVFTGLFNIIRPIAEAVFSLVTVFIQFNIAVTRAIFEIFNLQGVLTAVFNAFFGASGAAANFSGVLSRVSVTFQQLVKLFAIGAANLVASFVVGFQQAATAVVRVVADLAGVVADFLVGFSPPKRGPLSNIDKGGFNVAMAWVNGFASVNLDPVKQVAGEVSTALGSIATFGIDRIRARFAELDAALAPFQNRLEIIQSRFDAIAKPAEAAISAIDRQLNKALEALAQGDQQAAQTVKALDAQRAAIQANLDAQQTGLDRAKIQLALKQAEQSEERALLRIRQAQLDVAEKTESAAAASAARSGGRVAKEREKKGTGTGAAQRPEDETVTPNIPPVVPEELGTEIERDTTFTDALTGLIVNPVRAAGDEFNSERKRLAAETARIGKGVNNVKSRLSEPFRGARDEIAETFSGIKEDIIAKFDGIGEDAQGIVNNIKAPFDGLVAYFTDSRTPGTLASSLSLIRARLSGYFGDPLTLFSPFVSGTREKFDDLIAFFTDPEVEGSVPAAFNKLFGAGDEPGIIGSALDRGLEKFTLFYNQVFGEEGLFAGLSETLGSIITDPLVGAVNTTLQIVEDLINRAIGVINGFLAAARRAASFTPGISPDGIQDLQKISIANIEGAATGGIFTGGLLRVGEQGEELIAPAGRVAVFPNEFTQSLDTLVSALTSPQPVLQSSSNTQNTSINNQRQTTINVTNNGVRNSQSAQQRLDAMRFGRGTL